MTLQISARQFEELKQSEQKIKELKEIRYPCNDDCDGNCNFCTLVGEYAEKVHDVIWKGVNV